jgi:hypothetical protein
LLTTLPTSIATAKSNRNLGIGAAGSKQVLAQQAMIGQLMAEQANKAQSLGQVQADYIRGILPQLPQEFQGMAQYDAMTRAAQGQSMANAYTQAGLAAPLFNAYQNQLGRYQQILQQAQATGNQSLLSQIQQPVV